MKKCCMIGCGGRGADHLSHLIGFTDMIELSGFCDLIEDRARTFAKTAEISTGAQARTYTGYIEMLDDEKPDMIFLCVPPYCHGEIEFELIRRGIPFFVETPVALDLDLAREIRSKVNEKQLITAVGFQNRYSNLTGPNAAFCRENDIIYINGTMIGGIPQAFWWKDKELSGGQIITQAIHQLDILQYVFGEPEEVCTYGTRGFVRGVTDYNTDDASTTVVRFKNGAIAALTVGCYAKTSDAYDSKIIFSAADKRAELKIGESLTIYGLKEDEKIGRKKEKASLSVKNIAEMPETFGDGFIYRQSEDAGILCDRVFVEAVVNGDGGKILTPYAEAVKSLEFAMACNESLEKGCAVKVEYKWV